MRRILDILTSRWCVTLLAALVLGLLVWFAGPWIGFGEPAWYPLASEITRLVIILVIVLAWGAGNLIGQARVRRANQDLVEELKPDPDRARLPAKQAELARSFRARARPARQHALQDRDRRPDALSAAMVRDDRAARLRQDHGAYPLRPPFSGGRGR